MSLFMHWLYILFHFINLAKFIIQSDGNSFSTKAESLCSELQKIVCKRITSSQIVSLITLLVHTASFCLYSPSHLCLRCLHMFNGTIICAWHRLIAYNCFGRVIAKNCSCETNRNCLCVLFFFFVFFFVKTSSNYIDMYVCQLVSI